MRNHSFDPQAKLLIHGDRVKEWFTTGRTSPVLVEISPVGYCNAHCPWCSFKDKRSKSHINTDVMLRTLDSMRSVGLLAINWCGGGEPTLHPDFDKFVLRAHALGLKQGLFTNAYKEISNQECFSWIRVSMTDCGLELTTKPSVPFGVVLNQIPNQSASFIQNACLHARGFGASYFQIRPALTGKYNKQPSLVIPIYLRQFATPTFEVYVTDYKYHDYQKSKSYPECYGYHLCPAIDWEGVISVCPYRTVSKPYILGDLNKESFADIWQRLPDSVPTSEECWNCCKNHETNKLLYSMKHVREAEFI
jgi:MoaA/NifB/PqqE/SkfB family radical SAM enzyme